MSSRRQQLLKAALLFGVVLGARLAAADPTPRRTLLALSKHDHTLAIVDPVSLHVVAKIPVGPDPHEVVASADGRSAYVSIYGGGRYHAISVADLITQRALPDIDTGALNGPHGLDFVGGKLWFTAEGAKAIARYDPAAAKVDWIMGTGQNRTHMLAVTPDEKNIYTTNVASGTVSLLELVALPPNGPPPGSGAPPAHPPGPGPARMDWTETVIPVGKGDEGFDISPDRKELWTANAQAGTLSVIDLATRKVAATLEAKVFGANRLKFTPDGKRALISTLRGGDLVVFDVPARREIKRVHVGTGAAGILVDPVGNRAFVACTPDSQVAIINLRTLEVTGHLDVGAEPDGLAWATIP